MASAVEANGRPARFRVKHAGRTFLLASRRKGWKEFIENNVQPILSRQVLTCWPRTAEFDELREGLALHGIAVPAPGLVLVCRDRIEVIRLHEKLLPLRRQARKDRGVQQAVRRIVLQAIHRKGRS